MVPSDSDIRRRTYYSPQMKLISAVLLILICGCADPADCDEPGEHEPRVSLGFGAYSAACAQPHAFAHAGSFGVVQVYDAASGHLLYAKRRTTTETLPAGGSFTDLFEVDLELPANLPTGDPLDLDVQLLVTAATGGAQAFSAQQLIVLGWRLFE